MKTIYNRRLLTTLLVATYALVARAQEPAPATAPAAARASEASEGSRTSQAFIEPLMVWPEPDPVFYAAPEWTYRSCVEYAKWRTGHGGKGESWGNAADQKGNLPAADARPGDTVLTTEGGGHEAVLADEDGDWWILDEANYEPQYMGADGKWHGVRTEGRRLRKDDPLIKAYRRP